MNQTKFKTYLRQCIKCGRFYRTKTKKNKYHYCFECTNPRYRFRSKAIPQPEKAKRYNSLEIYTRVCRRCDALFRTRFKHGQFCFECSKSSRTKSIPNKEVQE